MICQLSAVRSILDLLFIAKLQLKIKEGKHYEGKGAHPLQAMLLSTGRTAYHSSFDCGEISERAKVCGPTGAEQHCL